MELQIINEDLSSKRDNNLLSIGTKQTGVNPKQVKTNPFIEANTIDVGLTHLQKDCNVPVFAKDNEMTLSHQEFIEIAYGCAEKVFKNQSLDTPEIRVSHQVKGRTPDAIHIPAKDLLDNQKTVYYERMAFIIRLPGINGTLKGNTNNLSLCLGGVRAYNHENLYSKKSIEKFKFFIGFQNMVCCNLCISTDGFKSEIRASSHQELESKITEVIQSYKMSEHLKEMTKLLDDSLNEQQFAQLLGKAKLYNFLPKEEKALLPEVILNDNHFNTMAKDYYQDKSFCKNDSGEISLWNAYNLLTGANKSSYIDTFLDRGENAYAFAQGISKAINGDSQYHWFLS